MNISRNTLFGLANAHRMQALVGHLLDDVTCVCNKFHTLANSELCVQNLVLVDKMNNNGE
jgi:hypothetical protein